MHWLRYLCEALPLGAIHIINLPTNLEKEVTHRYSANSFKLHRLPVPRPGQVLGLVGTNGIGKSTALKILAGKLKPNLGRFDDAPDWQDILKHFRGSELQNYFTKILEDHLKAIIKPQYVDHLPKAVSGKVGDILEADQELDNRQLMIDLLGMSMEHFLLLKERTPTIWTGKINLYFFDTPFQPPLDLKEILQREVGQLSGGEL